MNFDQWIFKKRTACDLQEHMGDLKRMHLQLMLWKERNDTTAWNSLSRVHIIGCYVNDYRAQMWLENISEEFTCSRNGNFSCSVLLWKSRQYHSQARCFEIKACLSRRQTTLSTTPCSIVHLNNFSLMQYKSSLDIKYTLLINTKDNMEWYSFILLLKSYFESQ